MATAKPRTATRKSSSIRVAKKKRGISRVQALVIVLVLAVIGVVAVTLSSASGTPNYQYSWNKYCVAAHGSSNAADVKKCKERSAEAMVYRLYRGLYDKSPDDGGYKFWTQKLAGDRVRVVDADLVVSRVGKMGSDTSFVKALYTDMLLRKESKITQKEIDQWVGRLKAEGNKKWSREKVAYQFAISGEAIRKNDERWTKFVASAPTVTVVQTAAQAQRKRFDDMLLTYQQPSARYAQAAQTSLNTAKGQLTAANNTASKNPPSAADLQSIKLNQDNATAAYNAAQDNANKAAAKAAAAKVVYDIAAQLANYATDIKDSQVYGLTKIGARYRATKQNATSAASYAASAKARIGDIAGKYADAKKKYDAEIARQQAIRDQKARDAAKRIADIEKLALAVRDGNCAKFSYTVLEERNGESGFRDVTMSASTKSKGCHAESSVWHKYMSQPYKYNVVNP